jgi:ABC-type glutathione transport system ATPase component
MTLLDIRDLRVSYPGRGFRAAPVEVLHGVSLSVGAGETLGVVGESGSGKTTIGRAVLGLVKPSTSRVARSAPCRAGSDAASPTTSRWFSRTRTRR